VDRLNR